MKGKFNVKGKTEMQFWIRAFQMEMPIEHAQKALNERHAEAEHCMIPIISEYEVGRLFFQMCLIPKVDRLGLADGEGRVWVSDAADREAMVEECAEVASDLLDGVPIDESYQIDTPKET